MKIDITEYMDYAISGLLLPILIVVGVCLCIVVAPFALLGYLFEKIFHVGISIG